MSASCLMSISAACSFARPNYVLDGRWRVIWMSGWRGGWQGERYWDEVPLTYCADHYDVHVRKCGLDDIVEIDTFKDMQRLDSAYAG